MYTYIPSNTNIFIRGWSDIITNRHRERKFYTLESIHYEYGYTYQNL